jgi:hypothetical protein
MDPLMSEVKHFLLLRSSSPEEALSKACNDIVLLHKRIWALEDKLLAYQRDQSAGYKRRRPDHPARAIMSDISEPVTDDWIATGRE